MKTPQEMAEDILQGVGKVASELWGDDEQAKKFAEAIRSTWLAGYKAGREMSNKEIFDYFLELRKKHGQQEPEHKPIVEKFSLTLIEKKGFF